MILASALKAANFTAGMGLVKLCFNGEKCIDGPYSGGFPSVDGAPLRVFDACFWCCRNTLVVSKDAFAIFDL